MNTKDIKRIRIGLGVDRSMDLAAYVLSPISKKDMEIVSQSIDKIVLGLETYIKDRDFEKLMQNVNVKG